MLDLIVLAKKYIPISIEWQSKPNENQWDMKTIEAVNSIHEPQSVRVEQVHRWLQSYHVLQSFTTKTERMIAEQVIAYADSRKRTILDMKQELILEEFKDLESRIQKVVPENKSGNPRKVTSLVSKAIWCCYPSDIPIYDNYAEHALQVICRLSNIKVSRTSNYRDGEYAHFLEAWFRVFKEIEPAIDPEILKVYPNKIRVFDSLLWYIGQPKFDLIEMG
jgi:hypothetical protein